MCMQIIALHRLPCTNNVDALFFKQDEAAWIVVDNKQQEYRVALFMRFSKMVLLVLIVMPIFLNGHFFGTPCTMVQRDCASHPYVSSYS